MKFIRYYAPDWVEECKFPPTGVPIMLFMKDGFVRCGELSVDWHDEEIILNSFDGTNSISFGIANRDDIYGYALMEDEG